MLVSATTSGVTVPEQPPASSGPRPRSEVPGGQTHRSRPHIDVTSVDLQGDIVIITDRSGTIVDVNDAFVRTTGYSRQEAIGDTPKLLSSGLHGPEIYRELWETVLKGQVWTGQLIDRHRDGRLRTHRLAITPIVGSDGQVTHLIAVQRDIAAQRAAPTASTGLGELHTDAEAACTFVDTEGARLLGGDPAQLYAGGWLSFLPSEEVNALRESLDLAVGSGRRQRLDLRTSADRWLHLEVEPVLGSHGEHFGAVWLLEDITDRMHTHARLARRDAVVSTLLEALPAPVALINPDGTVLATNGAWSRRAAADHPALAAGPGDDLPALLRRDGEDRSAGKLARYLEDHLRGFPATVREPEAVVLHPLPSEQGGCLLQLQLD